MEGMETSELSVEICFPLPFIPARASKCKPTYQWNCPWLSPKLFCEQYVANPPLAFGLLFLLSLKISPSGRKVLTSPPAAKRLDTILAICSVCTYKCCIWQEMAQVDAVPPRARRERPCHSTAARRSECCICNERPANRNPQCTRMLIIHVYL